MHARSTPDHKPPAVSEQSLPSTSRLALTFLFALARRTPRPLRLLRPLGVHLTLLGSQKVRQATRANAKRILGPTSTPAQQKQLAKQVIANFFDFVIDVATAAHATPEQLRNKIESVQGRDQYFETRKSNRGAIIVTAHLGSFEVGLAMLTQVEPHVHVVFKRDQQTGFESQRRALRQNLGVQEAPVDEGWDTWLALRDALADNQVVVMQADRALPGQRAQSVPFLHGHLRLPLGPLTLAQLSGSPLIPVFAIKLENGQSRLFAEAPIHVDPNAKPIDGIHPALHQLAKVLEKFIAQYPEQWLILEPAFVEDTAQLRGSPQ